MLEYLDSFNETTEKCAERLDAVVQLERRFILAEIDSEFTPKQFEVRHVALQFSQLVSCCLHVAHTRERARASLFQSRWETDAI